MANTAVLPKAAVMECESRKGEFPYVWYDAEKTIAIPIYTVLPYCVIIHL